MVGLNLPWILHLVIHPDGNIWMVDMVESSRSHSLGMPLGAVVCTAVLGRAVRIRAPADNNGMAEFERILTKGREGGVIGRLAITTNLFGDYSAGRWCWELTDIEVLPDPIPAKGRQMIGWPWSGTWGLAA
jgi:hypothetical protein